MTLFKYFYICLLLVLVSITNIHAQCPPPVPATFNQNQCGGGTYTLQVSTQTYSCTSYPTASAVKFNWYNAASGGTLLTTTAVTQNPVQGVYNSQYTVTVSASTDYWISTIVSGTESPRVKLSLVIESVVSLSSLPLPQFNSRCGAGPLTIQIGGPSSDVTYYWYYNSGDASPFATTTDPQYALSSISTTTNYYVAAQSTSKVCPVSARKSVTATVYPALAAPTASTSQTIFGPGTATVSVSGYPSGSSCEWFTASTGGSAFYTGTSYNASVTATKSYYVGTTTRPSCVSLTRKKVSVTVYPVPQITATGTTFYNGNCPITLSVQSSYSHYSWKDRYGNVVDTNAAFKVKKPGPYTVTVSAGNPLASYTSAPYTVNDGYNNSGLPLNYVVNRSVKVAGVKDECALAALDAGSLQTSVTFYDGSGRPVQQVVQKASPAQNDLVQPIEYDQYGRQVKQYLPYTASSGDGMFKKDWKTAQAGFYNNTANKNADRIANDANPWSIPVFENSPEQWSNEVFGPGAVWQTTGHSAKSTYRFNTSKEVRQWVYDYSTGSATGKTYYVAGDLMVTESTSEDGHIVRQYTDKSGQIVMSRQVDALGGTSADTYYAYDDRRQLRYIIPPQAVSLLSSRGYVVDYSGTFSDTWLYTYKYDKRGRLTEKKTPGAKIEFYIYDAKDRLVLSQDGNLRGAWQWMFYKYDNNDRLLISGLYTHTEYKASFEMQALFSSKVKDISQCDEYRQAGTRYGYSNTVWPTDTTLLEALAVSYYDDYDFNYNGSPDYSYSPQGLTGEASPDLHTDGLPTGSRVKILGTDNWLTSVTFYDEYNRPVQVQSNNHKNLTSLSDKFTVVYDFTGKVLLSKQAHKVTKTITIQKRYTYDHADRLQAVYQKINADAEVMLYQLRYNELGQVIEKNLHSEDNGATFLQSLDYTYNIRGCLTHINNSELTSALTTYQTSDNNNDDSNDLFGMELEYNSSDFNNALRYDGTITAIKWKSANPNTSSQRRAFRLNYDGLDRLEGGYFNYYTQGGDWLENGDYSEKSIKYDLNGNIKSLRRTAANKAVIDDMKYTLNGNQITLVKDTGDVAQGFKEVSGTATEYTYDANGNTIKDVNKGIKMEYNHLNLPKYVSSISNVSSYMEFLYTATGEKLRKKVYTPNASSSTHDYIGDFEYVDGNLYAVATETGMLQPNANGTFSYQHFITDHLGNVRMVFDKDSTGKARPVQEEHYYPFGLAIESNLFSNNLASTNKYFFNGMEMQYFLRKF